MSNKMALDALTAAIEAMESCEEGDYSTGHVCHPSFDSDAIDAAIEQARAAIAALQAEVASLAAQAAPSEQADFRQLMGMNEAEIDTELIAAGISPDDAVKRADRAIKEALATIRAERRASSGATTQAVRMLTREELNDVALSDQVGWEPGEYIEAVQRKFCAVNAGRIIPASGEIGGV